MELIDLLKATVVCGAIAFLSYSYPVVGQAIVIAGLTLLWSIYAWRTFSRWLGKPASFNGRDGPGSP